MYLKDGREIIESDKYPGCYVDQSNGAWCDANGNYVGGIADAGDKPGKAQTVILDVPDYVYVSKTGKQYYPYPTKSAKTPIRIEECGERGLVASKSYLKYVESIYKEHMRKSRRK